jgi:lambda repressor-like predicted transcriptional regulator
VQRAAIRRGWTRDLDLALSLPFRTQNPAPNDVAKRLSAKGLQASQYDNVRGVDYDTLKTQLPELKAEARRFREKEAAAGSRAEHLERIIASVEALAGPSGSERESAPAQVSEPSNGQMLAGIDAVRAILQSEDHVWKAADVLQAMRQRGWSDPGGDKPARAIAVALSRLERRGEAERVGYGRYRWKGDGQAR